MAKRYGTGLYSAGLYSAGIDGVAGRSHQLSAGRAYLRAQATYAARANLETDGRAFPNVTKNLAATSREQNAYGPELVENGRFSEDVSGWAGANTATIEWDSGRLKLINGADGAFGNARQDVPTTVGLTYEARWESEEGTGDNPRVHLGVDGAYGQYGTSMTSGITTFTAVADALFIYLTDSNVEGEYSYFDNVSVREVTPATAASAGHAGISSSKPLSAASHSASAGQAEAAVSRPLTTRDSMFSGGQAAASVVRQSAASTKNQYMLGPNKVSNGTFDSGTTGWTAASGTIAHVDGQLEVDGGGWSRAVTVVSTTVGQTYHVSMDFNVPAGTDAYASALSGENHIATGAGRITFSFVATQSSTSLNIGVPGGNSGPVYFDNVKLQGEVPVSAVSKGVAGVTLNVQYVAARGSVSTAGQAGVHRILGPSTHDALESTGRVASTVLKHTQASTSATTAGQAGADYTNYISALGKSVTGGGAAARRRRRFGALSISPSAGRAASNVVRSASLTDSAGVSSGVARVKRVRGFLGASATVSGRAGAPHYTLGAGARSDTLSGQDIKMRVVYQAAGSVGAVSGSRTSLVDLWRIQPDPTNPWTYVGHPHDAFQGES